MKLYEIADRYLEAFEVLTQDEILDGAAIEDTLAGIEGEFEEKAKCVAAFIRNIEAEEKAVKAEADRLKKRSATLSKQSEGMRAYLQSNMERLGLQKIPDLIPIALRKCPPSVCIEDESLLPAEYKETCLVVKVLKAQISVDLKMGVFIPGAKLESGFRLAL